MDHPNGERTPSYRRIDDPIKGRHLIATQAITKGQLLFVERPLLAFQSIQNLHYNRYVCYNCKAFVNTPANALLWRCRSTTTDSDIDIESQPPDTSKAASEVVAVQQQQSDQYCCIPCRHSCGYVYCSNQCETECWHRHHQLLCTGDKESNSHPIVQYKQYAIETNEILLLIAEWWISQHTIEIRSSGGSGSSTNHQGQQYRYTDFIMNPWWDVVTSDMIHDTNEPSAGYINGEVITVHDQLKEVCTTAAELLNQALGYTTTEHHSDAAESNHVHHAVPKITALDIARRIGAMEQNAMGIRQRSPLCSPAVLTDTQFRHEYHEEFVSCLQEAGLVDSNNNNDDNIAMDSDGRKKLLSHNDIALRLSKLYINEDFSVNDTNPDSDSNPSTSSANHSMLAADSMESVMYNTDGDDLDLLFPPLDGTAMYSIACKMNHSCHPNVILLYRRRSQIGAAYPLVALVVALRNIVPNEELTISYINANAPYHERQKDLQNYGFTCRCDKCEQEKDLMVDDNDNDDDNDDDDDIEIDDTDDNDKANSNLSNDGETRLQERLERLDSIANHSLFGRVPSHCYDPVSKYIVETANLLLGTSNHRDLLLEHHSTTEHNSDGAGTVVINLLESCVTAIQNHDYSLCKIVGSDLESTLLQQNRVIANDASKQIVETRAWSTIAHREAFFCGALVACIGYCHDYDFITAKRCIDNALQLGLPRRCIEDFVQYIEAFARQMQASVS